MNHNKTWCSFQPSKVLKVMDQWGCHKTSFNSQMSTHRFYLDLVVRSFEIHYNCVVVCQCTYVGVDGCMEKASKSNHPHNQVSASKIFGSTCVTFISNSSALLLSLLGHFQSIWSVPTSTLPELTIHHPNFTIFSRNKSCQAGNTFR